MATLMSGLERKVDVLGRIVIPSEIRRSLELVEGDALDVSVRDGAIVLAPVRERCPVCGGRMTTG